MHGKLRKLSAACKRVCVTLLVAEAHEQTMSRIASSLYGKFCLRGYIYAMHTATIKLFTIPDYKYEKKDEVVQQVQADIKDAAKPAQPAATAVRLPAAPGKPKQLPISRFF